MADSQQRGLPLEVRLCLRAGTVYYFKANELSSPAPHYFIVVNRDPLGDNVLLLSIVTSKVDKALARNSDNPDLVVIIERGDYHPLDERSAVECTKLFRRTPEQIAEKMQTNEVGVHQRDLPNAVLQKIRTALLRQPHNKPS